MDIVSRIAAAVAAPIINLLTEPVKSHFGYLFCYKKKIQELESEFEKLKDLRRRIQGMVDTPRCSAERIEADVSRWLKDVQKIEGEVGRFLEDINENENCFMGLCPDLTWCYRLGKEAEEMKASVITLKDEGRELKTLPVGHTAPYPEELQFTSSGDYMTFNSRVSVFNRIMEALEDSEVNLIGVHGPGGAGKTTLVEEVAKQAKKDRLFDEIVMAVVSKDPDVSKIQKQLAAKLNLTYKQDSEDGRAGELWNRLKGGNKKILVIVDDVWKRLDMKEIGIPIADGVSGCKVLLTTRKEGVCQQMEVQKDFLLGVLEGQEAWSLFTKAVGDFVVRQSVAKEVCKECGALPVAIVTVAAALKRKKSHVWIDALNQLRNSSVKEIQDIDQKTYTSLQWSYDYLEHEDAKSCFLLCCLFREDADIPIEDLVRYCMALRLLRNTETLEQARSRVQSMVDHLRSSCLLLRGRNKNYVKMHDVIRDVAISITSSKQEGQGQQWANKQQFLIKHGVQDWPDEGTWKVCTAVSIIHKANNMDELPGDLYCPELQTLLLDCGRRFDSVDLPLLDQFFDGMENLIVLCVKWNGSIGWKKLRPSSTNLVKLRMLQASFPLGDTDIIQNLKNNLEILILEAHRMKELPLEIGELTRLRLLDLRRCRSLEVIPQGVISRLTRMEELYIPPEYDQWEGSEKYTEEKRGGSRTSNKASLSELMLLKKLTTLYIHIPHVALLPDDLCFENLIRFQISVGEKFDDSRIGGFARWELDSSRALKLVGVHLKAKISVLINRAEVLCLRQLEGLETLFYGTHDERVSNLKYLEVIECPDLKYLWSPLCAKRLQQLQESVIAGCTVMEGIVATAKAGNEEEHEDMMIDFSQLKEMELSRLPKLISFCETEKTTEKNPYIVEQSLFNEKVIFPVLKKLVINDVPNTDIWGKQSAKSFCELKFLDVRSCDKVVNLFPSNMLSQLKNLESVSISYCHDLKYLWSPLCAKRLQQLQKLSIEDCKNLEGIVATAKERDEEEHENMMIDFSQLGEMTLWELPKLRSFFFETEKTIEENPYIAEQSLFNEKVIFPVLKKLWIRDLPNTDIWGKQSAESFCQLKVLFVENCDNVVNLIPSNMLSQLKDLESLFIMNCRSMKSLVEGKGGEDCIIEFPQLSDLHLSRSSNLESFCSSKFEAQSKFNCQVAFPKLKYISAEHLASSITIHLWNVMATVDGSLSQVKLGNFNQLTMVPPVTSHKLILRNRRWGVTQPFDLGGPNAGEGQVEPRIEVELLKLVALEGLTCFSKNNSISVFAWNTLKFLLIHECSFTNLFTCSVASSLKQLTVLSVRSCECIEEVVTNEGEGEAIEVNIEFPKLSLLMLRDLQNLESFCSGNCNFNFPSLELVILIDCPKMQTFTPGQARMPQIRIVTAEEGEAYRIGDLNKYLKGEGEATMIDHDEDLALSKGLGVHRVDIWRELSKFLKNPLRFCPI